MTIKELSAVLESPINKEIDKIVKEINDASEEKRLTLLTKYTEEFKHKRKK